MREDKKRRLFELLRSNEILKIKGYSLAYDDGGGIVVDRAGHVHGIWSHDARSYTWISPGNTEPRFRTEDVRSAVLYTVVVLAQT
ncbi:hypothetical protein [Hyphomicrobium sp. D-2]|uniref:hypothetical protein n=1 Tax=Hyphomicrobium sp. D-2 TaxID=3041621 RepID=UPI0024544E5D|nr:hypothetical protein [Hyphomicrobium sp. D-2]MDH4983571.1 hypothetical protein [Hyphomicrobium sp. D-2]